MKRDSNLPYLSVEEIVQCLDLPNPADLTFDIQLRDFSEGHVKGDYFAAFRSPRTMICITCIRNEWQIKAPELFWDLNAHDMDVDQSNTPAMCFKMLELEVSEVGIWSEANQSFRNEASEFLNCCYIKAIQDEAAFYLSLSSGDNK
ncbi:hypothetical protein [Shewanella frigidimarina]|uniref:hypothetical protein n=1 Tax=Shewanella frigidimarina TaxID=56812 RepID=UPI003D7BBC4B